MAEEFKLTVNTGDEVIQTLDHMTCCGYFMERRKDSKVILAEFLRLRRIEAAAKVVAAEWDGDFLCGRVAFSEALANLVRTLRGEEIGNE